MKNILVIAREYKRPRLKHVEFNPAKHTVCGGLGERELELTRQTGACKTFFHRKTVPLRFRTMDFTTKKGEKIKVACIADVVRWSFTGKRATQQTELNLEKETVITCASGYGPCE